MHCNTVYFEIHVVSEFSGPPNGKSQNQYLILPFLIHKIITASITTPMHRFQVETKFYYPLFTLAPIFLWF